MASQNPYVIESANPMQGLQFLSGRLDKRRDYNRKLAAANKEKELRKQAYDIMQSGTPEQVAEFITKNPGGRKIFEDVAQFKSEATKNNAIDTAKKILLEGVEVGPAMIERAQLVMSEGGDSKETIESAQRAVQDPERGRDWALKVLQLYEPDTYKTFISGAKDDRTTSIKEYEYGVKNPKFALAQKEKADKAKTKAAAGKGFKNSMDLRKEFTAQSADFQKVRDAYTRVVGSTENPSPAGDLSLIFNYMKMLDPGSVVRESEFATAAAAGSYGERIKAATQKVVSGERLSPKMRADFVDKSGVLMKGIQAQHKKREISYRGIAEKNNLDPNEVVVDLLPPDEEAPTATGPNGEKIIFRGGKWETM